MSKSFEDGSNSAVIGKKFIREPMSPATVGSYEFGPFRLDLERRVLTRDDQALPLAPKTFDLLVLLVKSAGRALSKQQLMQALWPDTFVEEANLSFQISVLRKALGEDGARQVETVPKHGYRFIAEVTAIPPVPHMPGNDESFASSLRARPFRADWRWTIATVALVAIGIAVYLRISQTDPPPGDTEVSVKAVPLTSYEGTEWAPSLSPDGSQVAFSWNGLAQGNQDIYVKLVGPGEPIPLTNNPARDDSPAWSPDGRNIAFLRWTSGNDSDVAIIVVPALGNAAERLIATVKIRPTERVLSRLCWTPDGKWLVIGASVAPQERHGIWLLSLDGGTRRRLTETPGAEVPGVGDFNPAFSSDGRRLAFVREDPSTKMDEIYVLPLLPDTSPAGKPEAVTELSQRDGILGLAWAPSDSALVFSASGYLGMQSRLHRVRLTSDRLHATEPPHVLPFGDRATTVTVSRTGRMVYAWYSRDSGLWRLNLTDPYRAAVPSGIPGSTFDEHTPAYSRDGKRIAFASTRTGTEELWVSNLDGSDLRQVTFIGGAQCANPQWSPANDNIILFNSRLQGSSDLYLLDLSSGRYDRITTDPSDEAEARWSRDGNWIYFSSNRTGQIEIWKMRADRGAPVQVTKAGGLDGIEGRDGFLYYAKTPRSPTSIWRVPIAGGDETVVVDGLSYSSNFAVGERGLYFMSRGVSSSDTSIEYFDLSTRKRTRLGAIGKRWWFGIALSPDEQSLMYSVVDRIDSNLMTVDSPW